MSTPEKGSHAKQKRKAKEKQQKADYEEAREVLLNKVVPDEEIAPPSWKWRLCCCCYYLFCLHCCFEKNKSVTKENFVKRFGKWVNMDIFSKGDYKKMSVIQNLIKLYAHKGDAITYL